MNYDTGEVREYIHTYVQMVYLFDVFPSGVMCERSRELVKTVIARAREFPDELKDKRFERTLDRIRKYSARFTL